MNADEQRALATLYGKWDSATLKDATTRRCGEYDPQALELMRAELSKRDVAPEDTVSPGGIGVQGVPQSASPDKQSKTVASPYIQYVAAWGLNYLLSFVFAILALGILFAIGPLFGGGLNSRSGEVGALVMILFAICLGVLLSFVAFRLSVKWMIVDRLLAHPTDGMATKDAPDDAAAGNKQ